MTTSNKKALTPAPEDRVFSFEWQDWFKSVYNAINTPIYKTKVGLPNTTDIKQGHWAIYKDTSGGTIKLYANDGGVLKSVALV